MRTTSDLEDLLTTDGVVTSVVDGPTESVLAALPLLQQIVAVTAAGPVITNDLGVHQAPAFQRDPLRSPASNIGLRLNPDLLGTMLVTEPTPHAPPTLRIFDTNGSAVHVTYLVEGSDRLAFEALSLSRSSDVDLLEDLVEHRVAAPPAPADDEPLVADQLGMFDSILADGGNSRRIALGGHDDPELFRVQVQARPVLDILAHAAQLMMPLTTCTAAPGCLQLHHDRLDGSRQCHGSMVLASGAARTMINFNSVAECWVTEATGAWGPTGAIELYGRDGNCCFVATQTGPVEQSTHEAWQTLLADLTDA